MTQRESLLTLIFLLIGLIVGALIGALACRAEIPDTPADWKAGYDAAVKEEQARHAEAMGGEKS